MGPSSGYRLVAHTADVRVEAWASTREECVSQAVKGMVASFAQVAEGTATAARKRSTRQGGSCVPNVVATASATAWLPVPGTIRRAIASRSILEGPRARSVPSMLMRRSVPSVRLGCHRLVQTMAVDLETEHGRDVRSLSLDR